MHARPHPHCASLEASPNWRLPESTTVRQSPTTHQSVLAPQIEQTQQSLLTLSTNRLAIAPRSGQYQSSEVVRCGQQNKPVARPLLDRRHGRPEPARMGENTASVQGVKRTARKCGRYRLFTTCRLFRSRYYGIYQLWDISTMRYINYGIYHADVRRLVYGCAGGSSTSPEKCDFQASTNAAASATIGTKHLVDGSPPRCLAPAPPLPSHRFAPIPVQNTAVNSVHPK